MFLSSGGPWYSEPHTLTHPYPRARIFVSRGVAPAASTLSDAAKCADILPAANILSETATIVDGLLVKQPETIQMRQSVPMVWLAYSATRLGTHKRNAHLPPTKVTVSVTPNTRCVIHGHVHPQAGTSWSHPLLLFAGGHWLCQLAFAHTRCSPPRI